METEGTLSSVFEKHVSAEFLSKDADQALETMADDPYVNHFVAQLPSDIEIVPVSRTIGQRQLVDEMIICFTHTLRMDWLLPGIPPTGRHVELPFVAIVKFEGDKIAHEHFYWDQASLLVQLDRLDRMLPVRGGEIAAQVLSPTQPMNELIRRAGRD